MTQLHNLSAILKGSDIYLKYYTSELAEPQPNELYASYERRKERWQASMQEVKFKDQERIKAFIKATADRSYMKGIPLDSLKHRIEVVDGCEVPECVNPHPCKPVAIIKPEPSIKSVTNCPTCGTECDVNEKHEYVPKHSLTIEECIKHPKWSEFVEWNNKQPNALFIINQKP